MVRESLPETTELAMIAATLWAAICKESTSYGFDLAARDALTLWQEARRVLQEDKTTTPDRARL